MLDDHKMPSQTAIEQDDRPLFTMEELSAWRARKAELNTLLGEAWKEVAFLARKIKAAEFLIKETMND